MTPFSLRNSAFNETVNLGSICMLRNKSKLKIYSTVIGEYYFKGDIEPNKVVSTGGLNVSNGIGFVWSFTCGKFLDQTVEKALLFF